MKRGWDSAGSPPSAAMRRSGRVDPLRWIETPGEERIDEERCTSFPDLDGLDGNWDGRQGLDALRGLRRGTDSTTPSRRAEMALFNFPVYTSVRQRSAAAAQVDRGGTGEIPVPPGSGSGFGGRDGTTGRGTFGLYARPWKRASRRST